MGQDVDANAQLLDRWGRLVDVDVGDPRVVQGQGQSHAADAAAHDDDLHCAPPPKSAVTPTTSLARSASASAKRSIRSPDGQVCLVFGVLIVFVALAGGFRAGEVARPRGESCRSSSTSGSKPGAVRLAGCGYGFREK